MSVYHIPIVCGVSVPIYKRIREIVVDILVIIKCMTHLSFVLIINEKFVNNIIHVCLSYSDSLWSFCTNLQTN